MMHSMKKNFLILFSLSAIFFVFGIDVFIVKKVNASNEINSIPDPLLEIDENKEEFKNIDILAKTPLTEESQENQISDINEIAKTSDELSSDTETRFNDPANFDNLDNTLTNNNDVIKEDLVNEELINKEDNIIISEEKDEVIIKKQTEDQEFDRLLLEALEEDYGNDKNINNDSFSLDIKHQAEIKAETDLDKLHKDEFNIEIIDNGKSAKISNENPLEKKDNNIAVESNINKIENNNDQLIADHSNQGNSNLKKIAAIKPSRKQPLSYAGHINHPLFSPTEFDPENPHLDPLVYREEQYQILYTAIIQKNIDVIEAVTNRIGVNNEIAVNGMPPIAFAVNEGDIHILIKLLSLGYSPNKFDDNGNSPLHIAILNDRSDMIVELVKFGADITAANAVKMRPLNMAYNLGRNDIVYLLEKVGAKNIGGHRSLDSFIINN
jgi:hypothetical protein